MYFAGLPANIVFSLTFFVRTEPAPKTPNFSILLPVIIVSMIPIIQLSSIIIFEIVSYLHRIL